MNFKPIAHHRFVESLNVPTPYNISDSCCEPLILEALLALSNEGLPGNLELSYASISGQPKLRQAIADLYTDQPLGNVVDLEQVTVFCGAQDALFAAFHSLLEKGDEAIVYTPCYPSLIQVPLMIGAKITPIALQFDQDWQFSIEAIRQRITSKTKLIVINSPHNPTGALATREFADELLTIVRSKGIYLLTDDVSIFSDFDDIGIMHPYLSYEKTVAIGVLSKSFGLGGVRIGWTITGNATLRRNLSVVKSYTSICPSLLDEHLALVAVNNISTITDRNNEIIRCNIAAVDVFINETGSAFEWCKPKAGIMTLMRSNIRLSVHELARLVAYEEGVLLFPGDLFTIDGSYFRLGLGRRHFPEMLSKFRKCLRRHGYLD